MKRLLAIGALIVALTCPALAYWQSRDSNYNVAISAGGTYTGPGDVISTNAKAYVSCTRAWTAAYASSHGNACDLIRSSDSTTCTMVFATNGNADVATTNSCTTGTQTVTQFCNATTCKVSQVYDQTGNSNNFTQGTGAAQPTFDPAGAKVMVFAGGQNLTTTGSGFAQIYSMSGVAKRTSGTSTSIIFAGGGANELIAFHGANLATEIWNSAFADFAATDGSCHSIIGVANAASSTMTVDGSTSVAGTNPGSASMAITWNIGSSASGGSFQLTGTIREVIVWSGDITSSLSALATNQTGYGGC